MAKRSGKVRISGALKARLNGQLRQSRRETVYKMQLKHNGVVPCFVCKRHVPESLATLEHVIPLSQVGNDEMDNLAISHGRCNRLRGCLLMDSDEFIALQARLIREGELALERRIFQAQASVAISP